MAYNVSNNVDYDNPMNYWRGKFAGLSEWQLNMVRNYTVRGRLCLIDFWESEKPEGVYCNASWDGYNCWPATPANETIRMACPEAFRVPPNNTDKLAHRTCGPTGEWPLDGWSNYTACVPYLLIRYINEQSQKANDDHFRAMILRDIYFFGSIVSFILLAITFFVFSYFKSLQCSRISIHKNLVVSFLIKSIVIIVMFEPFVTGRTHTYRDVEWLCKAMNVLQYYTVMANIFWTFVEGLFLHNRVAVSVFNKEAPFKIFHTIGWGLPALIVLTWSSFMYVHNADVCWNGYFGMPYIWIILLPIIASLTTNAVFLCNIIRILLTKLRTNNTLEACRIRKAVKATVVLFPLLGLTNVLFFMSEETDGASEMAYRVFNAVSQATQGIFVSIIYCFMNSEVRTAVRKRWQRYRARRLGKRVGRRRSSRTSSIYLSTSDTGAGHQRTTSVSNTRRQLIQLKKQTNGVDQLVYWTSNV